MLGKNNTRLKLMTKGDKDSIEEWVRWVSDKSIGTHKLTNKLYLILM